MPAKKTTPKKTAKKPSGDSPLKLSEKELNALIKRAEADMKKHGFKSVDELTDYYDGKRGY